MKNSKQLLSEKQLMLDEVKTSAQSIALFCKERNIAYHSFFYWQKKLNISSSSTKSKFLKLSSSSTLPTLPLTEPIYPNGKRIVFHFFPEISILRQLMEQMLFHCQIHSYFLYTGKTDMRKGIDSLPGIVSNELKKNPLTGDLFMFMNARRTHLKMLHGQGDGFVLYYKRL